METPGAGWGWGVGWRLEGGEEHHRKSYVLLAGITDDYFLCGFMIYLI